MDDRDAPLPLLLLAVVLPFLAALTDDDASTGIPDRPLPARDAVERVDVVDAFESVERRRTRVPLAALDDCLPPRDDMIALGDKHKR